MSYRHDPHRPAPFAPPTVDPIRTRKPECRHCGEEIAYVEMADSGKLMPCDPVMLNGDGRRSLVVRFTRRKKVVGRVVAKAPEDVVGLEPHWGTCPVLARARRVETARKSRERGEAPPPAGTIDSVLDMVEVPE